MVICLIHCKDYCMVIDQSFIYKNLMSEAYNSIFHLSQAYIINTICLNLVMLKFNVFLDWYHNPFFAVCIHFVRFACNFIHFYVVDFLDVVHLDEKIMVVSSYHYCLILEPWYHYNYDKLGIYLKLVVISVEFLLQVFVWGCFKIFIYS